MRYHFCSMYLVTTCKPGVSETQFALCAFNGNRRRLGQEPLPDLMRQSGRIFLPANELVEGDRGFVEREQLDRYDGVMVSFDAAEELAACQTIHQRLKRYHVTIYKPYGIFVLKEEIQVAAVQRLFSQQGRLADGPVSSLFH